MPSQLRSMRSRIIGGRRWFIMRRLSSANLKLFRFSCAVKIRYDMKLEGSTYEPSVSAMELVVCSKRGV